MSDSVIFKVRRSTSHKFLPQRSHTSNALPSYSASPHYGKKRARVRRKYCRQRRARLVRLVRVWRARRRLGTERDRGRTTRRSRRTTARRRRATSTGVHARALGMVSRWQRMRCMDYARRAQPRLSSRHEAFSFICTAALRAVERRRLGRWIR